MIRLDPGSAPWAWRGSLAWTEESGLWQPWRLPPERLDTAHAPRLFWRARMPAGVRAVVHTDASAVELPILALDDEVTSLDVTVDGTLWRRLPLTKGAFTAHVGLPPGTKKIEMWLPQFGEVRTGTLLLHGATHATAAEVSGLRWVTYGSSITHCRTAAGPSETWPALVARQLGWDLTCLGFGGECHLDPVAAQAIARTPADLVSLCLGINIYGAASFGPRTLAGQVSGFIQTVRDAHPGIPIAVISPIVSPSRERTPNDVGLTLEQVRGIVADAVTALQRSGQARLHLIDGPGIFGPDDAHLLPDGLHPDPEGYRLMAQRMLHHLAAIGF
ncbi:MAG TPA: GDSL-type esterase/lipase family protein [Candidatus Limnocylindrales bacterium]